MSAAMMMPDLNPAAIAVASNENEIRRKAPKKAGRNDNETHVLIASPTQTGSVASGVVQPISTSPASGSPFVVLLNPATGLPIVDGHHQIETHSFDAIDNSIRDAAIVPLQPVAPTSITKS